VLSLSSDVIAFFVPSGHWVLYNVFTRTSIGGTHDIFDVLSLLACKSLGEVESEFGDRSFATWETEVFSNSGGLLADPTRLQRGFIQSVPVNADVKELVAMLKTRFLLVEDESAYRARFAPKRTILDRNHFGNFHQQLSYELIIRRRQQPARWWLSQKFEEGFGKLNNNLYRAVQEYNLRRYCKQHFRKAMTVLDVGCGIGYYTEIIAETGASVIGVDPNREYLDLAKKRSKGGVAYHVMNPGIEGGLKAIPDRSIDCVFMSDALLFYFVPEGPDQEGNIDMLLQDVRRILKTEGSFVCVDPHYLFWLTPWLGEERFPFTIIKEYTHKTFGVTPSLSALIQAFGRNSFGLIDMEEFQPDPAFEKVDRRAYFFAREYPLWQLYEWRKMEAATG
jgi:SAM-dependent methyltransferase